MALRLLDTATDVIGHDAAAAIACIERAAALLRSDLGGTDHRPNGVSETLARGGLAPWQMRRLVAHVETAMGSTIRLRDGARIARLSPSYFSRVFRISFGETFAHYVATRRTERAKQMMLRTGLPLSQIAIACGFADQAHFTSMFRGRIGVPPAAWRRQHAEPPAAE